MKRTYLGAALLMGVVSVSGGMLWWWAQAASTPPETMVVPAVDRTETQPLHILMTLQTGSNYQALICERAECRAGQRPNVPGEAVTDGVWWYYYDNKASDDQTTPAKTYLRRAHAESGENKTIMESTPLTAPRGLILSPDGRRVAFFLDNVHEPDKQLTEIWVYDVDSGGIRLLAEKLYRPDIRSWVRWNSTSTYLWFIADTGPQTAKEDQLELILVSTNEPKVTSLLQAADLSELTELFTTIPADVLRDGSRIAYAEPVLFGRTLLTTRAQRDSRTTTVKGQTVFVQWLENGSLLYAAQDQHGFTFWREDNAVHRFIARRPGDLTAARSDQTGAYVAFAVREDNTTKLYSLHVESGIVTEEGALAGVPELLEIAYVVPLLEPAGNPSTISAALDDAELAAFVENNLATIVSDPAPEPLRLITTDTPNTIFLDYRASNDQEERLLLTINDAINAEWVIKGRYESVSGTWRKVQGGSTADSAPRRLYEWEAELSRWILKESY